MSQREGMQHTNSNINDTDTTSDGEETQHIQCAKKRQSKVVAEWRPSGVHRFATLWRTRGPVVRAADDLVSGEYLSCPSTADFSLIAAVHSFFLGAARVENAGIGRDAGSAPSLLKIRIPSSSSSGVSTTQSSSLSTTCLAARLPGRRIPFMTTDGPGSPSVSLDGAGRRTRGEMGGLRGLGKPYGPTTNALRGDSRAACGVLGSGVHRSSLALRR